MRLSSLHILPKSTFGRIALLIGGLLLINQLVIYVSFSIYFTEPFTKQIMHLVAMSPERDFIDRFVNAIRQLEGAFSLVALSTKKMIGCRDALGIRPLVLGDLEGA